MEKQEKRSWKNLIQESIVNFIIRHKTNLELENIKDNFDEVSTVENFDRFI